MITQDELDRVMCGEHCWASFADQLIVGFEVVEQIWEGKPYRPGLSDSIKETRVIGTFANFLDAEILETQMRERNQPNRSYYIQPIQVKAPSEQAQKRLSAFDMEKV